MGKIVLMKKHKSLFELLSCYMQVTMNYYAVAKGRNSGVYRTWNECKMQVDKYSGAVFKKFSSLTEANSFIDEQSISQTCRKYSRKNLNPYTIPKQIREENNMSAIESHKSNNLSSSICQHLSNSMSFQPDAEGRVDIYTDGACSSNGTKAAKAGLGVYFGDNHPANVSKPVRGRATNNNAEIQAVTEAARIARNNGLSKIRINTDSEFLINCKTKWMAEWKARGWKTANKQPVINRKELEEMERALAPLDVEFKHVRGHNGIYGNEMADKLAKEGANMYEKLQGY